MRKSNVGRNRLLAAVALIACLCMMILAGCTGVSRSADKPVLDEATVVRVVDGDTFVANIDGQDEKIRLIGVDTPESVNPDESKNTERGKEASENTKSSHRGQAPLEPVGDQRGSEALQNRDHRRRNRVHVIYFQRCSGTRYSIRDRC